MTTPMRRIPADNKEVDNGSARLRASPAINRQALIDGLNHDLAGEYQTVATIWRKPGTCVSNSICYNHG